MRPVEPLPNGTIVNSATFGVGEVRELKGVWALKDGSTTGEYVVRLKGSGDIVHLLGVRLEILHRPQKRPPSWGHFPISKLATGVPSKFDPERTFDALRHLADARERQRHATASRLVASAREQVEMVRAELRVSEHRLEDAIAALQRIERGGESTNSHEEAANPRPPNEWPGIPFGVEVSHQECGKGLLVGRVRKSVNGQLQELSGYLVHFCGRPLALVPKGDVSRTDRLARAVRSVLESRPGLTLSELLRDPTVGDLAEASKASVARVLRAEDTVYFKSVQTPAGWCVTPLNNDPASRESDSSERVVFLSHSEARYHLPNGAGMCPSCGEPIC